MVAATETKPTEKPADAISARSEAVVGAYTEAGMLTPQARELAPELFLAGIRNLWVAAPYLTDPIVHVQLTEAYNQHNLIGSLGGKLGSVTVDEIWGEYPIGDFNHGMDGGIVAGEDIPEELIRQGLIAQGILPAARKKKDGSFEDDGNVLRHIGKASQEQIDVTTPFIKKFKRDNPGLSADIQGPTGHILTNLVRRTLGEPLLDLHDYQASVFPHLPPMGKLGLQLFMYGSDNRGVNLVAGTSLTEKPHELDGLRIAVSSSPHTPRTTV